MRQKTKFKAVLFDMDGVLLDSFHSWFRLFNSTLHYFGLKRVDEREFRKHVWGGPIERDIKEYFKEQTVEELAKHYFSNFHRFKKYLKIFPQTKDVLAELKKKDIKIGLVTNTYSNVAKEVLSGLGIINYFDVIVCGDNVKRGKPAPDMMLKACRVLKTSPKETILIGDTKNDMISGKRAGCLTVGYKIQGEERIEELNGVLRYFNAKILALDFDGVIADSQYEALFSSYSAYLKMAPQTRIFDGKQLSIRNYGKVIRKHKKTVDKYARLRPYTVSAADYFTFIYAIDKNIEIKNIGGFKKLSKKLIIKSQEFVKIFYKTRKDIQRTDFEGWIRLSKPYKKIVKACREIRDYKIVVVTNNEAETVIKSISSYGIKIAKEDIYDRSIGKDKKDKIKVISKKYRVDYGDIYFIDDQIESLIKAKTLGVNCYLALWGYNNAEQRALARKKGISLLSQEGFNRIVR